MLLRQQKHKLQGAFIFRQTWPHSFDEFKWWGAVSQPVLLFGLTVISAGTLEIEKHK